MIEGMNHVSFTVSDLDAAIRFYRDGLGFALVNRASRDRAFAERVSGVPGAEMDIAYLTAADCTLELIEYVSGEGVRLDTSPANIGSAHLCLSVSDYDAFLGRVIAFGGRLRGPVLDVPAGPNIGRKVVYTCDPDGNNLEFFSLPPKETVEK